MKKLIVTSAFLALLVSTIACSINSQSRSVTGLHDDQLMTGKVLTEEAESKARVTFINEDSGISLLGLTRFILDENGEPVDYELMNLKWSEKKRVIELAPGLYGVTKFMPQPNAGILEKIKGFQKFEVKDKDMMIHFPSMDEDTNLV